MTLFFLSWTEIYAQTRPGTSSVALPMKLGRERSVDDVEETHSNLPFSPTETGVDITIPSCTEQFSMRKYIVRWCINIYCCIADIFVYIRFRYPGSNTSITLVATYAKSWWRLLWWRRRATSRITLPIRARWWPLWSSTSWCRECLWCGVY